MKTATSKDSAKMITADSEKDYGIFQIVTPFDYDSDEKSYKWVEIREALKLNSNVANAKWLPEKLLPLLENLAAPELLTPKGRATKFCAQMLFRYDQFCNEMGKDYEVFAKECRVKFSKDAQSIINAEFWEPGKNVTDGAEIVTDSKGSTIELYQVGIRDSSDDLEARFFGLQRLQNEVAALEQVLETAEQQDWENQILEDEIAKQEAAALKRKREVELRLKIRQALGNETDS